ncbi:MAG: UDP-N-acetylmuramoyl-L-alanyl-D-glutamate--2,6-diaminopimelate ligase [Gammaproteobacteria bacterium]|nr:MAG: UDP-N-acetylmuramoyl-L-alanyl-D-glutamate--2,6-diaminopimelate ligase [Gammaproteobacteria bacterium]
MSKAPDFQCEVTMLMAFVDANTDQPELAKGLNCTGITEDSRAVSKGDIFVARPGAESDGRRYIHQATARGAIAVLCESRDLEQFIQAEKCPVPVYQVENLAMRMGKLGDIFYQHPSNELSIIGVTGTNGKTSCSQLMARVADNLGHKAGIMGTLGNGPVDELIETGNTTTGALNIQADLADFKNKGIEVVCMEVSSHALAQGRVNGVKFKVALFTNLTRDHLDYHGNMQRYAKAKKLLLARKELESVVINADDTTGAGLIKDEDIKAKKYSFSITPINARDSDNSVWTESVTFHDFGIDAKVATPWGKMDFSTPMIGQFNLSNCLGVITTLGVMGFSVKDIGKELNTMAFVKGRMERFGGHDKPLVIVDYAHTEDALKHVLQALKPHTNHKLWCIFGCGGDRDKGKRPQMAAIAEEYTDHLILTSDNPRSERVDSIIQQMMKGLNHPTDCEVEFDRELAIRSSISRAVLGDVVLVAGKGHEQFQHIGKEKIPHSDVDTVKHALEMGSWK